jgi:hypothetical protein
VRLADQRSISLAVWGPLPKEIDLMQKVVLCLTLSLALVFGASLGAGEASAQGAFGKAKHDRLHVTTKTVEKFITRRAKMVAGAQSAVFPNAYIFETDPLNGSCARVKSFRRPTWFCLSTILVGEENRSNPDQFAFRDCSTPIHETLRVRRARSSRKLRLVGGWKMSCALTEDDIARWNARGPEYQPHVTEATPYEPLEQASRPPAPSGDDLDILPPPSGEPGTPPLGPMKAPPSDSATSSRHDMTCSGRWEPYWVDTRYWIYVCYWREHSIFGVGYNTELNYSLFYWAGDYNSDGYAIGRLFYTGVVPQINYVHS